MYNKGMGVRGWRWVLLIENNIQMVYLEEETPDGAGTRDNLPNDPFELTHAQQMLDLLKNRDQVEHINEINAASANENLELPGQVLADFEHKTM